MLGFKGFRKDLTCNLGKGRFQYEPGKWYEEPEANCQHNGFHLCENPLDVFRFYPPGENRYFLVEAAGDINERDDKISCTRIMLKQELSWKLMLYYAAKFIIEHPYRKLSSQVDIDSAECGKYAVVVGNRPKVRIEDEDGVACLIQTKKSGEVHGIAIIETGEKYEAGAWYSFDGKEVKRCRSGNSRNSMT